MKTRKTRVLLADDHVIVRDGLRTLLSLETDIEVVAEADDGGEACQLTEELRPDIVIMDIGMPNLNGVEAARKILSIRPDTAVIALSVHDDRRYVSGMLTAGARGYLLKNCAGEDLVQAIRNVMAGRIHISPAISGVVVEEFLRQEAQEDSFSLNLLTNREREVLRLLALGQHNKEIAASLGLSTKTIETHRQHIMEKLDRHSIADLTRYAIREGLVSAAD